MADLHLIEELRDYLITQGVVRAYTKTSGSVPQCILAPRDGTPEPAGQAYGDAVVALEQTNHVARPAMEEFLEEPIVDVTVRSYRAPDAELVQRRIRHAINGENLLVLDDLVVEWVRVWLGDRPLGADAVSYWRRQSFRIGVRVKALQGMPYAP